MIPDPVHTLGAPTGHRRISLGPRARFSFLVHWRSLVVAGIALLVVLAGSVASLTTGAYPVSLDMFLDVFQGRGGDLASFIVLEQRLPRVTGRSSPVACSGCRERSFRASPATRWAAPTSSVSRGAR